MFTCISIDMHPHIYICRYITYMYMHNEASVWTGGPQQKDPQSCQGDAASPTITPPAGRAQPQDTMEPQSYTSTRAIKDFLRIWESLPIIYRKPQIYIFAQAKSSLGYA